VTTPHFWLSKDQLERATWSPGDDLAGKAGVVLDVLVTGTIDSPEMARVREDMRWVVTRMCGALTSDLAPRAKRCLAWRKQRRTWPARIGLYIARPNRGEHDYHCLFCDESLDTVSDKRGTPRTIPNDKIKRWVRHAAECACQVVLEVERWRARKES
jgi:hypothetical protein